MSIVSARDPEVVHQVEGVGPGLPRGAEPGHGQAVDPAAVDAEHVARLDRRPAAPASSPARPRCRCSAACRPGVARSAWPAPRTGCRRSRRSGGAARPPRSGRTACPPPSRSRPGHLLPRARKAIVRKGERYFRQSSKLVVERRSAWSFSTSTSWVIEVGPPVDRRRRRRPGGTRASSRPFSAIRQWPPKTRSVVDSVGPALAYAYAAMQRPDWPTTRSVRYRPLADRLVARREVQQDVRPGDRLDRAGRDRHPEVLADLDPHDHPALGLEQQVDPERDEPAAEVDLPGLAPVGRAEPAALVELLVIRDELLGDDPEDRPVRDRHAAVVQAVADRDRQPDHDQLRRPASPRRSGSVARSPASSKADWPNRSAQV